MRLNRLAVTNHARIADVDVEVRRHAVIVGANDVGKTSILRLLNLLLGASTGQMYQQLNLADLSDPDAEMTVEARLIDFSNTDRALFTSEIDIDATGKSESLLIRLTVGRDPSDPEAVEIHRWFPESGHTRGPSRDQLIALGWRYLPATRGASAAAVDGPNSALQTLLGTLDLGAERAQLVNILGDFNTKLDASAPINDLRDQVAGQLSMAMPRAIGKDDLAVRTAADPEEEVLGNVSMFLRQDDKHVPMSEQSDGLRQLMSMTLFDLAEGSANVVAIDEPELHLHPSSQRTVSELFAAAKNQKILVTHSPFIVQRFEPSDVIAVNRTGQCHQIPTGKLSAVEKQRANWWSPRLLEVLTARFAIVVEGASDRIIVERAAKLHGVNLDRIGAVVFDIDGAHKFPNIYKLIGKDGFDVTVLGLVDEKEKMIWHGAIGGKPKDVFNKTLWVSGPDLEVEYCTALTGPGAARALIAAGYCDEAAIRMSCSVTKLDDVSPEQVAAYCRKGKVEAAAAIASQLDGTTVAKITSINGMLEELRILGAG